MTGAAFEGTKTATVNAATLAYREQGEGESVVFVHGTASDLRTFDIRTSFAIVKFGVRTIAPATKAFQRGQDEEALRIFGQGVLGKQTYARLPEARKQQMRDNVGSARAQILGAGFPPSAVNEAIVEFLRRHRGRSMSPSSP